MSGDDDSSLSLQDVAGILRCRVLCCEELLGERVTGCCAADMMSDVLAFGKPGMVLLTGQANAQAVRTANVADLKAVVFVRGKHPDDDTVKLARSVNMPLLSTRMFMYEACGRLFENKLGH
jgi:hypothetical protein